jgi:heme-degrading monooxygenase HmoA
MAAELHPELEKIDWFISVKRFESRTEEGKYLSFLVWHDEEAVRDWREVAEH